MVALRKHANPVGGAYGLCDQVVTTYSFDGAACTRTVHPRAFLDERKNLNVDKTGSKEASAFLLVIPGNPDLQAGDKAVRGEGPDVPERDVATWWRSFIPSKVAGLVVVKYVDRKYVDGLVTHVEAGG